MTNEVVTWRIRIARWLRVIINFLVLIVFCGLVINILSTWLTIPKGVFPPDAPLFSLLNNWPIILFISGTVAAFYWWAIIRRSSPASSLPIDISPQDRKNMLKRLRLHYEQTLSQSLQGAVRVKPKLTMRSATQNATNPALRLQEQTEQSFSLPVSVIDVYDKGQQALLILGFAGVGKSTLLTELGLHLIEQAEFDNNLPLPILLPLSGWSKKHQSLDELLIEEAHRIYGVSKEITPVWISKGFILPLLDGLDEVTNEFHQACISAINVFYHHHSPRPLVVCCRTDAYERASREEPLALPLIMEVQPLSIYEVDTILAGKERDEETQGKDLRQLLKHEPALREIATTPLMLQVLGHIAASGKMTIWKRSQPKPLLQQIWQTYVTWMIESKGEKQYDFATTITRLQWLAQHMQRNHLTDFFLEDLQWDWLPKKRNILERWKEYLNSECFARIFFALVVLAPVLFMWLTSPSPQAFWLSLPLLLGMGVLAQFRIKKARAIWMKPRRIVPVDELGWSWRLARQGFLFGVIMPLIMFLLLFFLFVSSDKDYTLGHCLNKSSSLWVCRASVFLSAPLHLWMSRVGSVLEMGMLTATFVGFRGKTLEVRPTTLPNGRINHSLKNGVKAFGVTCFFCAVGEIVILGLAAHPIWTQVGLFLACVLLPVFCGFAVALNSGLSIFLEHRLLRWRLDRAKVFPWDSERFLQDATTRHLLYQQGGGYKFIHVELQNYFARGDAGTPTASPSSPNKPTLSP